MHQVFERDAFLIIRTVQNIYKMRTFSPRVVGKLSRLLRQPIRPRQFEMPCGKSPGPLEALYRMFVTKAGENRAVLDKTRLCIWELAVWGLWDMMPQSFID